MAYDLLQAQASAKEPRASWIAFHCVSLSEFVYSLACCPTFVLTAVREHSDKRNWREKVYSGSQGKGAAHPGEEVTAAGDWSSWSRWVTSPTVRQQREVNTHCHSALFSLREHRIPVREWCCPFILAGLPTLTHTIKIAPVSQVIFDSVNLTAPTITPTDGHSCFFCILPVNNKGMNMTHQSLWRYTVFFFLG